MVPTKEETSGAGAVRSVTGTEEDTSRRVRGQGVTPGPRESPTCPTTAPNTLPWTFCAPPNQVVVPVPTPVYPVIETDGVGVVVSERLVSGHRRRLLRTGPSLETWPFRRSRRSLSYRTHPGSVLRHPPTSSSLCTVVEGRLGESGSHGRFGRDRETRVTRSRGKDRGTRTHIVFPGTQIPVPAEKSSPFDSGSSPLYTVPVQVSRAPTRPWRPPCHKHLRRHPRYWDGSRSPVSSLPPWVPPRKLTDYVRLRPRDQPQELRTSTPRTS